MKQFLTVLILFVFINNVLSLTEPHSENPSVDNEIIPTSEINESSIAKLRTKIRNLKILIVGIASIAVAGITVWLVYTPSHTNNSIQLPNCNSTRIEHSLNYDKIEKIYGNKTRTEAEPNGDVVLPEDDYFQQHINHYRNCVDKCADHKKKKIKKSYDRSYINKYPRRDCKSMCITAPLVPSNTTGDNELGECRYCSQECYNKCLHAGKGKLRCNVRCSYHKPLYNLKTPKEEQDDICFYSCPHEFEYCYGFCYEDVLTTDCALCAKSDVYSRLLETVTKDPSHCSNCTNETKSPAIFEKCDEL